MSAAAAEHCLGYPMNADGFSDMNSNGEHTMNRNSGAGGGNGTNGANGANGTSGSANGSATGSASGTGASSLRMSQFYKTKTCPWFFKGRCERGESCRFAHDEREKRALPDLTRTSFCPTLLKTGLCSRGARCRYAHHVEQLRATNDMYKTSLCFMYMKSRCDAGAQCRHAHGMHELRGPVGSRNIPMAGGPGPAVYSTANGDCIQSEISDQAEIALRDDSGQQDLALAQNGVVPAPPRRSHQANRGRGVTRGRYGQSRGSAMVSRQPLAQYISRDPNQGGGVFPSPDCYMPHMSENFSIIAAMDRFDPTNPFSATYSVYPSQTAADAYAANNGMVHPYEEINGTNHLIPPLSMQNCTLGPSPGPTLHTTQADPAVLSATSQSQPLPASHEEHQFLPSEAAGDLLSPPKIDAASSYYDDSLAVPPLNTPGQASPASSGKLRPRVSVLRPDAPPFELFRPAETSASAATTAASDVMDDFWANDNNSATILKQLQQALEAVVRQPKIGLDGNSGGNAAGENICMDDYFAQMQLRNTSARSLHYNQHQPEHGGAVLRRRSTLGTGAHLLPGNNGTERERGASNCSSHLARPAWSPLLSGGITSHNVPALGLDAAPTDLDRSLAVPPPRDDFAALLYNDENGRTAAHSGFVTPVLMPDVEDFDILREVERLDLLSGTGTSHLTKRPSHLTTKGPEGFVNSSALLAGASRRPSLIAMRAYASGRATDAGEFRTDDAAPSGLRSNPPTICRDSSVRVNKSSHQEGAEIRFLERWLPDEPPRRLEQMESSESLKNYVLASQVRITCEEPFVTQDEEGSSAYVTLSNPQSGATTAATRTPSLKNDISEKQYLARQQSPASDDDKRGKTAETSPSTNPSPQADLRPDACYDAHPTFQADDLRVDMLGHFFGCRGGGISARSDAIPRPSGDYLFPEYPVSPLPTDGLSNHYTNAPSLGIPSIAETFLQDTSLAALDAFGLPAWQGRVPQQQQQQQHTRLNPDEGFNESLDRTFKGLLPHAEFNTAAAVSHTPRWLDGEAALAATTSPGDVVPGMHRGAVINSAGILPIENHISALGVLAPSQELAPLFSDCDPSKDS